MPKVPLYGSRTVVCEQWQTRVHGALANVLDCRSRLTATVTATVEQL
jgi:hypothetical protein